MLHLGQRLFLQRGRGRVTVPAAAQQGDDRTDIHFGNPAAGHDMHLVFHAGNGENGVQIFHFDEFMHQYGKIRNVIVADDTGQHNVDAVDRVMRGRLDHVVQQTDLFGADFAGDHRGNGIEIGPFGQQKCSGGKIVFGCRGKSERTRVFINPQTENGGFVRGDVDLLFTEYVGKDRDRGTGQPIDTEIGLDIGGRDRMVIVDMNFDILPIHQG